MSSETEDLLRSIDKSLKSLLRLQAKMTFDDDATNREKVKVLHQLGFDAGEMAEVIGTSSASVRSTRSNLRSDGEID